MTNVFSDVPWRRVAPFVLAIAWLLPAPARAQVIPGSRVLVMPFAATVDPGSPGGAGAALWLGEAASVLVTEGLTNVGIGALDRDERVAAFDRLDLPMSGSLTEATIIRVAELMGASDVIFGEIHLGQELDVRARIVRLDTGREMPVVKDASALSDVFALFGRVTGRLATETGRLSAPGDTSSAAMPLEAFENYVKGLVAPTPAGEQRFLETAERQVPSDARVLMALWRVYGTEGMADKALAAANTVPSTARLAREARFAVAISLIQLKRFDGASQALTALYATGHDAAISNALGIVEIRRPATAASPHPAAEYFRRATDEDPDNVDYLFNLGYAYALAGDQANALTWLRETVRFDATNGDAHLVMSAVLAASGRSAESQREFELARQLGTSATVVSPGTRVPGGLERLAMTLNVAALSRLNAAIADPAERDQEATAAFHLGRARTFVAAGNDREATSELRRAIYLQPYADEPHLLLGRAYLRAGRASDAADEFKVALWCRETVAGHVALGQALLAEGDREAARKESTRALAMAPDSPDARDLLKRIGG